ncbi:tRNA 2-selenouridine(34) synthase MnmH [Gorillibacterium sp. sgz5001074]|uniref:tRNA 2-selenouridine(34) synthase MnmH n=1 Tax=Gorillibacterium sp. sgz5001074 TaxID=3446695 RepID=UPI003F67CFB7
MFQDLTIEEFLTRMKNGELTVVDVRSESEYEDSSIPGSRNIPLFDDEERREVGTLYKQVSVDAAKEKGLEIVSRKLPAFIKELESLPGKKAVFCWRGGMRSKTTATLMSLYGIRVYRLYGGFRAYRKWVVETLESYAVRPPCYVIHGHTGTGKTKILKMLTNQGEAAIDLEGLAGHRGSIFGQVGLKPNNQKTFESLLVADLFRTDTAERIWLEAESKRVGKVVLPEFLVAAKESGKHFRIDLPMEERVRNIIEDYRPEEHREECLKAFDVIERRIHTPVANEIKAHLLAARYAEAVELLLIHYYDPRYEHAASQYAEEPVVISARTTEEAAEKLLQAVR